ncbi:MAG: hypothetical protein ACLPN1_02465 [Dissulfurispiraceae bacterium]|jgi:hypothetical protein
MLNLNISRSSPYILKCVKIVILLFPLVASILILEHTTSNAIEPEKAIRLVTTSTNETPPYVPVYRIPLRVHVGKSGQSPSQFMIIFDEINNIWWSQAGICFEIQTVTHDKPLINGLDIWFLPILKECPGSNGYYIGDHEIYVRDNPILGFASHPAQSSAARTTAHELGHVLGLHHRQNSDDNLMRSKTYGWQLNEDEIRNARTEAARKAFRDLSPLRCGTPEISVKD